MAGGETAALEVVHMYVDIKYSGSVPPVVEVLLISMEYIEDDTFLLLRSFDFYLSRQGLE